MAFLRIAVLALLAAPVAASAQDPSVLATTTRAATVGAAGGWTAWSAYQDGAYVLVTRSPEGVQSTAPVASRKVPFDLDLGTDSAGRVVAAYSRCTKEPTLVGGANATAPNYTSGSGCRIELYNPETRSTVRLPRSRGSSSDVLPSVGGDRIAFVAVTSSKRAHLRWRTARSAKVKTLASGSRRTGPPTVSGGPAAVDTDGKRVAVVWRAQDEEFNSFDSVLRVGGFAAGTRYRQVAFGVNGEACNYDQVLAPTLSGTTVSFLETNGSEWVIERTPTNRDSRSFGTSRTGEPGAVVTSAALDGTRLVVAETASAQVGRAAGTTQIRQLEIAPFGRTSPITFCDGG